MEALEDDATDPVHDPGARYARKWGSSSRKVDVLDAFLQSETLSPTELVDVLRKDLVLRLRHGLPAAAEEYIHRLPGIPPDPDAVLDLVCAEYSIREELGEHPAADDYIRRFPEIAKSLRIQLTPHDTLAPNSTDTQAVQGSRAVNDSDGRGLPRAFGRYLLLKELGRGGMGTVFLADDTQLRRQVALKIPISVAGASSLMRARFQREAQTAALLNHPQLCPVFDIGQIEGVDFLTMPYIPGGSLADIIKQGRRPSPDAAATLIIKAALALEMAHQAGVVHRDLKPANILVNERDEPVITDFGLALRQTSNDPALTEEGTTIGSVSYMPPEQIHYDANLVGPRSDIYSLGIILYELLVGRAPFQGNRGEIIRKKLNESPVPPSRANPELDPRFDAICIKALTATPEGRFQTMAEFAESLAEALRPSAAPAARTGRDWIIPGMIAAVLLISAIAWRSMSGPRPQVAKEQAVSNPDPFEVGAVWSGRYQFLPPHDLAGPVSLSITERDNGTFRGKYFTEENYSWMVEGTIEDNKISWDLVTPLSDQAKEAVPARGAVIRGELNDSVLTAEYVDHNDGSRSRLTLRKQGDALPR